jgi:chromosome segregation ATPase
MQPFASLTPQLEAAQERTDAVQRQSDNLSESYENASERVRQVTADAAEMRAELDQMREMLATVVALKGDLEGLLGLEGRFDAIDQSAGALSDKLGGLTENFTQIATQQDQLLRTNADADARLAGFSERYNAMTGGLEEAERRVAKVEETLGPLARVAMQLPDTKRQLSTLHALGDHVSQKIAALEQQRDAVDRATARAERLSEMVQQVDRQIQQQQASAAFLTDLADDVGTMRTSHEELNERLASASERQQQLEEEDRTRHDELVTLHETVRAQLATAQDRFEFERVGLDTVSQRIVDLREGLTSMEDRFHRLGEAADAISATEHQAERLLAHTDTLAQKLSDLEPKMDEVTSLRAELERMGKATQELRERLDTIQDPVTTNIQAAEQRVADMEIAVTQLQARAQQVAGLSEQIKHASQQLAQGDSSLEQAMAHLDEVAELRREASALVTQLQTHIGTLHEGLTAARQQGSKLTEFADTVQRRADKLESVEEAVTRFESRMADWEAAEQHLAQASEQTTNRQAAVDAVRDEMQRMFQVAEQTVEQVRSINDARSGLGESKEMLDDVMAKIQAVGKHAQTIDDRKLQFEEAEAQFSRIEALMLDMQSSMRTLQGQQAFLEQVVSVAGSLTFQAKQAEAMIATLRDERQMAERIRPSE